MKSHEEPCSGEKMSEILAQLQLEEIKGAREKQQQKEKEYQRYFGKFYMKFWPWRRPVRKSGFSFSLK